MAPCKKCGEDLPADLSATYLKRQLCRQCYNEYRTPKAFEDHTCRTCCEPLTGENIYVGQGYVCKSCFVASTNESRKKRKQYANNECEQEEPPFEVVETFAPLKKDHLYAMQNSRIPNEIKVGRSHDPEQRARELQKCQNFTIQILKVWHCQGYLETTAHKRLKVRNVTGHFGQEWFRIDLRTLELVIEGLIAESQLS
jgi:T5orf172 domain